MDAPILVIVADDHPVVLAGIKALVTADTGFEVVGEAGDYGELRGLMRASRCDVLVLDINLPGLSGLVIANRLVHRNYISSSAADGKYGVTAGALDAGAATKKLVIEGGVARLY